MSERTAVYRLFGEHDELIYVGVSKSFGQRWLQHAASQSWWPEVNHQTIYWYNSREDALLAEKKAIHDERPARNKLGLPAPAQDRRTGFMVAPHVAQAPQRIGSKNKTPLIGWHSADPTLKPWVEAEAARRGITRRELLDEALAGYRERAENEKAAKESSDDKGRSRTPRAEH